MATLLLRALILTCVSTQLSAQLTCGSGLYVGLDNDSNEVCLLCPFDTYKVFGSNSATECTPCPDDAPRNHQTGSNDPDDCKYAACGQGQQYDPDDFLQCIDCDIGTYQDKTYPLEFDVCENCPTGTSTASTLSTSTDCVAPCPSGQEYINDACMPCAINYYKDVSAVTRGEYTSCVQCPDSAFRTESTGSTSVSDCNIVTCAIGTYTDVTNNVCVPCDTDQYQNEVWQTSCNDCPLNHGTLPGVTGANDISLCFRFCPDGEELIDDLCYRCAIGYYKDNSDDRFPSCTICPDEAFITDGTGSTQLSACSIANCSAGSYRDTSDNTCQPCPLGQHQSEKWQTTCIHCPSGETTEATAAMSQTECKTIYEHVFIVDIVTTSVCSANADLKDDSSTFYTTLGTNAADIVRNIIDVSLTNVFVVSVDGSTAQFVGFRCFDDFLHILLQATIETTETDPDATETSLRTVLNANMADGSLDDPQNTVDSISVNSNGVTEDDIAQSSALSCPAGSYIDITNIGCAQCPQGTYQPVSIPELCFPCPRGFTTAGVGAIGDEALCNVANPDDYYMHTFQVEIATTVQCTAAFADSTSTEYQALYQDAEIIVRNVLIQNVVEQYRLSTPVVSFIGYRCNSPIEILLEIQMANLEATNTDTLDAILAAIRNEMTDGTLSDPLATQNVDPISVDSNGPFAVSQTLSSGNLNCADGQQTNLVSGQCEDCPQGTYNPEGVPELCFECPSDTTTEGAGVVLPTGNDPQTVCTVSVTNSPIDSNNPLVTIGDDSDCPLPYFLWDDLCVTNCPTGYASNADNMCLEDSGEGSSEGNDDSKATTVGIAIGVSMAVLCLIILVVLVGCMCMRSLQGGRRSFSRSGRGDKRFLDEAPPKNQSSDLGHVDYRSRVYQPYKYGF